MRITISRIEEEGKITLQESAGLAIVTINRPGSRNALTAQMWQELAKIGKKLERNDKTRVVLVRGAGPHFTAGSDIKEFYKMDIEQADQAFVFMESAISIFENLAIPTIASINGPAMGAGLELALACDIRIGSSQAKMGIPIGRLGITLSQKFAHRLVNLLGPSRTKDLIYTGRIYNGQESYDLGLLNYMVEESELESQSLRLANEVASQSQASVRAAKEAVAKCTPVVETAWSSRRFPIFVDPIDFPEGVSSFVEKRKPNFRGKKEPVKDN
jgi:enoyl-CoA hydratase